jgi:8-oxo-dGTP pyrophosphatase MutT (NUDIX family)
MCSDDGRAASEGSAARDEASLPSLSTRAQPLISTADGMASIIEAIPADDESPRTVDEICLRLGLDPGESRRPLNAIFALLKPLEVLDISQNTDGADLVKASTRHSLLFLHSYAAYLRERKSILADWDRSGNPDGPYFARETLSGPEFLYLIERQRSAGQREVIPLREASVAQVIIKAHVRGLKGDCYLMQFDSAARQFQLIGGHRRSTDPDDQTTAIRELEEELSKNQFVIRSRDQLRQIGTSDMVLMSRAFGVNTEYHFSFFQLTTPQRQLELGPADRWVTHEEIKAGVTREGTLIAVDAINSLDAELPGASRVFHLA